MKPMKRLNFLSQSNIVAETRKIKSNYSLEVSEALAQLLENQMHYGLTPDELYSELV